MQLNVEINYFIMQYSLSCIFPGKFAEVSDPTVGVDFFARLPLANFPLKSEHFSHSGWLM